MIPAAPLPDDSSSSHSLAQGNARFAERLADLRRWNRLSMTFYVLGFVCLSLGLLSTLRFEPFGSSDRRIAAEIALMVLGALLMLVATTLWVGYKGRHREWGVLGVLGICPLLAPLMLFLRSRCLLCGTLGDRFPVHCRNCGGPLSVRWSDRSAHLNGPASLTPREG